MQKILMFIAIAFIVSCNGKKEDVQHIVDQSILKAGGDIFENVEIKFQFRDIEYGYKKTAGSFEYVRLFKDSIHTIRDILTNTDFIREIDGEIANVPDSMARKYSNSVNSVIYFALLPYGLNDAAVRKAYLGKKTINEREYFKIRVTFDEKGGGEDFEDVFVYWIDTQNYSVDYLAYEYHTEGGGIRFRQAFNERYVDSVRFVDYVNYKATKSSELGKLDDAFINQELEELSQIKLENIKVNRL